MDHPETTNNGKSILNILSKNALKFRKSIPDWATSLAWLTIKYLLYTIAIRLIVTVSLTVFAVFNGVRPPLEGVPYVSTVALMFSVATTVALSAFFSTVWIFQQLTTRAELLLRPVIRLWLNINISSLKKLNRVLVGFAASRGSDVVRNASKVIRHFVNFSNRHTNVFFASTVAAAATLLVGNMAIVFGGIAGASTFVLVDMQTLKLNSRLLEPLPYLLAIQVTGAMILLLIRPDKKADLRKLFNWSTVIVPFMLIFPPVMGGMLSFINYGGGVPIKLSFQDGNEIQTNLLIRTNEAVFLYNSSDNYIDEIQLTKIHKIQSTPTRFIVYSANNKFPFQ